MTIDVFLALLAFAFVSTVTPGPNNFMLLASGVNFGFFRTIPHMFGIAGGFCTLLLAVGFGLGALLAAYPPLHIALKAVGGAYLLYLAYKIATSTTLSERRGGEHPLTFLQAAAFQWVNPKAWVLAVTAMAIYTNPAAPFLSVVLVVVAFMLVNSPTVAVWAGFGVVLRKFLSDPARLRWFNRAMAVLLVLTLVPLLL